MTSKELRHVFRRRLSVAPAARPGARPQILKRFARDESGSLLVFGLMMFVLMLMCAGISVDLMHYETRRAQVQSTLDTAVLSAASLDQTLDPESVVKDYFAKAGLSEYLSGITVDKGLNYRTVSASADVSVQTNFMHMMGIDTLGAPASSTAQEKIGNVEIALALDVSGSMASNSKIQNLRTAAKQFVDTMFTSVDEGKLAISVVPYAAQANVGAKMLSEMGITRNQTYADCVDFTAGDFQTTAANISGGWKQAGSFDPYTGNIVQGYGTTTNGDAPPKDTNLVCPPDKQTDRVSLAFSDNKSKLENFVGGLQPGGNTSIDIGMKWATTFLDPSMQPVAEDLISKGDVSPNFANRPAAYSDRDTMKVIVVMTDGENTPRSELQDPYRSGNSIVWRNTSDGSYSIYDASRGSAPYWSQKLDEWRSKPYGEGSETVCTRSSRWGGCSSYGTVADPGSATRLTWPEVWQQMSIYWFNYYLIYKAYDNANNYYDWAYKLLYWQPKSDMDSNLHNICSAAKAKGITIYSIGFETNSSGEAVLKDCATSPAYYFSVQGLQIADAFASIASNINRLRLIQ